MWSISRNLKMLQIHVDIKIPWKCEVNKPQFRQKKIIHLIPDLNIVIFLAFGGSSSHSRNNDAFGFYGLP